jgi:AcrR family transcriptional regulator
MLYSILLARRPGERHERANVSRTVDETRPIELLDAIVAYLVKRGIADLSLRPLAKAVGSSPRVLLYYFGSKEKMLAQAVRRLRERQRLSFGQLRGAQYENPSDACRAIWREMRTPAALAVFQLSLETFTLALRHRRQFARFLSNSVEDWLQFMAQPLIRQGATPADARAYATIVIAGFRGFLLDYCATRDSKRINQAVEMWIATLNPLSSTLIPGNAHGRKTRTQNRSADPHNRSAGVLPAVARASSLPRPSPRKSEP